MIYVFGTGPAGTDGGLGWEDNTQYVKNGCPLQQNPGLEPFNKTNEHNKKQYS